MNGFIVIVLPNGTVDARAVSEQTQRVMGKSADGTPSSILGIAVQDRRFPDNIRVAAHRTAEAIAEASSASLLRIAVFF